MARSTKTIGQGLRTPGRQYRSAAAGKKRQESDAVQAPSGYLERQRLRAAAKGMRAARKVEKRDKMMKMIAGAVGI